jgi:hypothetical protein
MALLLVELNTERKRGVIAEKCECCGQITRHRVSQNYNVWHFLVVPLHYGTLQSTVVNCMSCGAKRSIPEKKYRQFLSEENALALSIAEVLQLTNPDFAARIAHRVQLEQEACRPQSSVTQATDLNLRLALARLADLNSCDSRVMRLRAELTQWETLNSKSRDSLLAKLNQLTEDHERHENIEHFVRLMGLRFPIEVDPGPKYATMLALIGLGIVGALSQTVWGTGLLVVAVTAPLAANAVHSRFERHVRKRWFRSIFVPELQARESPITQIFATFAALGFVYDQDSAGLRAMLESSTVLKEVLDEFNELHSMKQTCQLEPSAFEGMTPVIGDPRVLAAFGRLGDLNLNEPVVIDLHARLAQWGLLDSEAQHRLLAEVESVADTCEQKANARRFVYEIAQRFPTEVDIGPALGTFLGLGATGIVIASCALGDNLQGIVLLVTVIGTPVSAYVVHRRFERYARQRWFRITLLPEARSRSLRPDFIVDGLEEIDSADMRLSEGLRSLCRAASWLKEVLVEESRKVPSLSVSNSIPEGQE